MLKEQQLRWAYQKYWVMAHSQQSYNEIRQLFKNNTWSLAKEQELALILADTQNKVPTVKTLTTAYQHVWGYFKKKCTPAEKQHYLTLLANLTEDNDELGPYLKQLTIKYQIAYLLDSRLIQEIS